MTLGTWVVPTTVTWMPRTRPADTFGQRLLRLPQGRGCSQRELSDRVGVSQRMMTYYEREAEHPPAYLMPGLAEALLVRRKVAGGAR